MRKHPQARNRPPVDVCMCFDSFKCRLHRDASREIAKEEADALEFDAHETPNLIDNALCRSRVDDNCPWNPDDLPERLRGFGYRGADQDGYDGSEWVTPQEDFEAQMLEAARVLLDAREV